ncbi:Probable indole-3-acetic acid-amido synthetase GH3.1 [Striga hermonthica]|uniref:Probable indole-3-acetic acid-amido synthetase GH3.1 n=1 Tax=Striga hermonthica TaxID=68872 RepID=A0A9N7RHJ4_STRHE|nr:Probable indole-3-acetic acid-amido synthetase GH3.1 [Striga hermonthica]
MAANLSSPSPVGPDPLQLIEHMTQNAGAVQESLLTQILAQNAETDYLKGFSVDGVMDLEAFKSKVPLVTYEDIQPLIRRMADGDHSPILCAQPISQFLISSGSVGEPKLIPSTKEVLERTLLFCSLLMPVVNKHMKGLDGGIGLNFMFTRSDARTHGGTLARLSTSSLYKSDIMKNRPANIYTSPNEAIYCPDPFQSTYTQLLCGLYNRARVDRIETTFASALVRVLKFLHINWKQLTHDIRTGSLDPRVIDESIRGFMSRTYNQPNPELADSIARECAKDNWEGIITRIWPHAKYLWTIATGTMAQYIPTLDYYSGGLPIVSMTYASSESYLGINLQPTCKPCEVSYTFMPFIAYFEFLPSTGNSEEPVDLVNVEIGKEYEVVVTNGAGLYRYRLGDIVLVTGFYNSAPQFRFVRRKDVVLNIEWEKTKETELQAAVEKAAKMLLRPFGMGVADYTSFVDTTSVPDHYVMYWELLGTGSWPGDEVLERCCFAVEESLNLAYRMLRAGDGPIGPLEIRVVRNGAFEEVMENAVSRGVSISQYKVPRCVGSLKPVMDILESQVVSKHFSPSPPSLS